MNTGLGFNITANDREFLNALNRSGRAVNTFSNNVISEGDRIELMFNKMSRAAGMFGASFSVGAFIKKMVDVRGEMQMLESSFEVLLGGKGVSGFMSEMKQFAVDSPLSMNGVANAAQTLLGFGIAAEKVMPTIKQIGDISMGNEERFRSLSLAFAQMSATGRLMGQDLLQMINAGFNPLQVISEKTGKSIGDLKKSMENGAISSQMVADAFASATAEGGKFHGMTQKQAEGIRGLQAQLQGGLQDAFNELGQSQESLIIGGYKVATTLVENYDKVGKVLITLVSAYGAYKAVLVTSIALEKARNTIAVYDIATKQIQLGLTLKNIAAQSLLNKVMMANPYALAAVLVISLAGALWALSDSSSAAERAQAALNRQVEKQTKANEEERSSVEGLIATIKDDTKTRNEKQKALDTLQSKYPAIFLSLDLEKIKNLELADALRQVNEELEKRNGIQSRANIDRAKEILKGISNFDGVTFKTATDQKDAKDILGLEGAWDRNIITNAKLKKGLEEYIKKAERKIQDDAVTASQAEFNSLPKSNRVDILKGDVDKLQAQYDRLKALDKKQKDNPFSSGLSSYSSQMDILESQINAKNSQIKALQEDSEKTATHDKAYWEKQKKDAESRLAILSDVAAQGKEGDALRKEILGYNKKLKAYDTKDTSKAEESKAKKAQDIIDQNEKIKQLENKQSLDRKRQGEDLANQEIQARISAMQSGAEKIREQKELDNKLEIQALERQKEDYIRKIIQDEREKFDAQEELKLKKNPKYTKKTFDPSSYISNDAISNLSLQMNSLFQQKGNVDLLARPLVDAAKLVEKGWEDAGEGIATVFSSQFGILDKDGEEVEILVTPILPNGDVLSPNELEDYIDNVLQGNDISKADNLGIVIGIGVDPDGEAGDQLHKLQAELLDLKEKYTSIDTSFFDNIIDSTKLRQQNDVLETDKQAWNEYLKAYGDYEDKRLAIFNEYREKIGKAQTQGEKALLAGNRDKELQDLDQTLIEKSDLWVRLFDDASKHTTGYITETIKKVQQLIDYMKGVEGVEIPIGFTPEQIESLKKDPEKVKEILKGLKTQVDELNTRNPFNSLIQGFKDLKKAGKDTEKQYTATNKIISGIQGVREVVGQLSTAFTDLGMNSEDSLAKVMNVMDRTASMAQTGAQIGGAWGAAIGGAIGLTTSLISAFKGKSKAQKDTEQLQDITSKIETTNNSINRLLEKRIDLINEATAAEAGYLNTLTQEQIKQQQTYVQSMFDRLSGNEIFGKKGKNNNLSLSALMQKEGLSSMEEFVEWWNSNGVNKLIGEGYDLKNEDQWQSIVDSWEELSEAAENAEKAMKEAVTGISFDSLKDSLDDLVKSADTTFEDIGDSFNDHMRTAALKFAKSSYLTKALQDWYDKFAEYAQSGSTDDSFGLTSEETAELRKMYEDAYNKAQGLYDSALDAMGISKEDSDINGITGVAASITQDSANELNGNFYAVRQSLNDVRNINKQTQEYIKVQTGHISDVKEAVSSYKQVFADQLEYQKQIAENTAATASILRDIRDKGIDLRR